MSNDSKPPAGKNDREDMSRKLVDGGGKKSVSVDRPAVIKGWRKSWRQLLRPYVYEYARKQPTWDWNRVWAQSVEDTSIGRRVAMKLATDEEVAGLEFSLKVELYEDWSRWRD